MRGFGILIVAIAYLLPLTAQAATAHSSLMVTVTAVENCSIQMDHHAFKHQKKYRKMKRQHIHAACAGGALAYQVYEHRHDRHFRYAGFDKHDRRSRKDDSHFEKYSEHHDDGVRWLTAEF